MSIKVRFTWEIHATTSSGSCNPSAIMEWGGPMTSGVAIEKIRAQTADIHVYEVLTEMFHCHPEKTSKIVNDKVLKYHHLICCMCQLHFINMVCKHISALYGLPEFPILFHWQTHLPIVRTHCLPHGRPDRNTKHHVNGSDWGEDPSYLVVVTTESRSPRDNNVKALTPLAAGG